MPDPKEIIGEAGVKALANAGFTITPPRAPEPVRLVTMEESRERFVQGIYPAFPTFGNGVWGSDEGCRDRHNAADDWLVRTVNKRIIEGLLTYPLAAYRPTLLRIFCGEGA